MLRRYNELPPYELSTPQEYLELDENERYLRAFSRFYSNLGPSSTRRVGGRRIGEHLVEFPTFIASLMTRTEDRSAVVLRASEGEFNEISYRLFTFTFEGESGTRAEYRLLSERFGIVDESYVAQPTRYMQFEFQKNAEGAQVQSPINDDLLTLTLGETDQFPNRITTNGNHTLYLDHATNLVLPSCPAISVGQHALRQVTAA